MLVNDRKRDPWNGLSFDEASKGVIACDGEGRGCVLWAVGAHLRFEMEECRLFGLGDLGLDDAPAGISIWEGKYIWQSGGWECPQDGEMFPKGAFRAPTDDEWQPVNGSHERRLRHVGAAMTTREQVDVHGHREATVSTPRTRPARYIHSAVEEFDPCGYKVGWIDCERCGYYFALPARWRASSPTARECKECRKISRYNAKNPQNAVERRTGNHHLWNSVYIGWNGKGWVMTWCLDGKAFQTVCKKGRDCIHEVWLRAFRATYE